jgi:hypothetical protein
MSHLAEDLVIADLASQHPELARKFSLSFLEIDFHLLDFSQGSEDVDQVLGQFGIARGILIELWLFSAPYPFQVLFGESVEKVVLSGSIRVDDRPPSFCFRSMTGFL